MIATDTQNDAILAHLVRHRGQWVPLPDLWRVSGALAVATRISNLRAAGHAIENRQEFHGRERLSYYRLVNR